MTKKLLTITAILLLAASTTAFGNRYHRDNDDYRNRRQHSRTWNRNSRYYRAPVRNRHYTRRNIRKQVIRRRILNNRRQYRNRNYYRYNR